MDDPLKCHQIQSIDFRLTENKSKADLWLLNSCTVKNPSEAHFKNEVNQGLAEGRKVVVSGSNLVTFGN